MSKEIHERLVDEVATELKVNKYDVKKSIFVYYDELKTNLSTNRFGVIYIEQFGKFEVKKRLFKYYRAYRIKNIFTKGNFKFVNDDKLVIITEIIKKKWWYLYTHKEYCNLLTIGKRKDKNLIKGLNIEVLIRLKVTTLLAVLNYIEHYESVQEYQNK